MFARLPSLGLVLGALLLAGCAQPEPLPGPGAGADAVQVAVLDNVYQPADVRAAAGQAIVFTNQGQSDHTVTIAAQDSDDPLRDDMLAPGDEVTVADLAPGTYRLRCTIHSADYTSGQVGTITVA